MNQILYKGEIFGGVGEDVTNKQGVIKTPDGYVLSTIGGQNSEIFNSYKDNNRNTAEGIGSTVIGINNHDLDYYGFDDGYFRPISPWDAKYNFIGGSNNLVFGGQQNIIYGENIQAHSSSHSLIMGKDHKIPYSSYNLIIGEFSIGGGAGNVLIGDHLYGFNHDLFIGERCWAVNGDYNLLFGKANSAVQGKYNLIFGQDNRTGTSSMGTSDITFYNFEHPQSGDSGYSYDTFSTINTPKTRTVLEDGVSKTITYYQVNLEEENSITEFQLGTWTQGGHKFDNRCYVSYYGGRNYYRDTYVWDDSDPDNPHWNNQISIEGKIFIGRTHDDLSDSEIAKSTTIKIYNQHTDDYMSSSRYAFYNSKCFDVGFTVYLYNRGQNRDTYVGSYIFTGDGWVINSLGFKSYLSSRNVIIGNNNKIIPDLTSYAILAPGGQEYNEDKQYGNNLLLFSDNNNIINGRNNIFINTTNLSLDNTNDSNRTDNSVFINFNDNTIKIKNAIRVFSFGNNKLNDVQDSCCIGYQNSISSGSYGCCIGRNLNIQNFSYPLIAIGQYNEAITNGVFVVGNGTANDSKSNAFEIYKDGSQTIILKDKTLSGTTLGIGKIEITQEKIKFTSLKDNSSDEKEIVEFTFEDLQSLKNIAPAQNINNTPFPQI